MKMIKKILALSLSAVMAAACLASCGNGDSSKTESGADGGTEGSSDKTIVIGGSGPLTGGAAQYGVGVKNAVELAIKDVNASGELGDIKLSLAFEDDEADPADKAVNAYNTLKDKGMDIMVGTVTTGSCLAVIDQTKADNIFQLTPSASAQDVIRNDNCFQVCFTDPNQGKASAQYIAEHKLGTKVAVIYNNADVYSTGIRDTFVEEGKALGLEIVSETTFTDETTDFTVQVADAQNAGAEIVFLPIYYTPASLILKTAADKAFKPIFFGVDGMDGILSVEGFDTSLAEGVMLLTPFVATSTDEKVVNFVTKYQAAYNEIPIQFAADAYDGIYILIAAAEKAGITSDMSAEEACDLLIAAIQEITVDGITGSMTWDASGAVTKTPMAATIVNGEYVFE